MMRLVRLSCVAVSALLSATAATAETVEQLYEKAKPEKTLVFYAGGPTAPYEGRIKQFQENFPGIQVSITGGFSNVLNQNIEKQMADGKLEVDLAFFQTVQDFANWKKRGVLLPFKPDGFDQIMPNLRDPDGAYMSFAATPSSMPTTPIWCAPRMRQSRHSISSSPRFTTS